MSLLAYTCTCTCLCMHFTVPSCESASDLFDFCFHSTEAPRTCSNFTSCQDCVVEGVRFPLQMYMYVHPAVYLPRAHAQGVKQLVCLSVVVVVVATKIARSGLSGT